MSTRRQFLRSASLAGAALAAPRLLPGMSLDPTRHGWISVPSGRRHATLGLEPDDPRLRELAHRALDAARSAGAQYADVRFTRTRAQICSWLVNDYEQLAVGVRTLVNGAWGFVASPTWTADEMVRLGTQSARQAANNKWNTGPGVDFGAPPPVATGTWSTPVTRDAFDVSIEEKLDFINGVTAYGGQKLKIGSILMSLGFQRQERTFASTEGAFTTQVLHTVLGGGTDLQVMTKIDDTQIGGQRSPDFFGPVSGGYEVLSEINFYDLVDTLYDDALRMHVAQGVDLGRYDVVFDAYAMAALVGQTIGQAMEIDRVRGFEANAGGTSYLAPPADMLGKHRIGSSTITIRANRSTPRGAATVQWDDDGVTPQDFDLIEDGMVVDYATSRQHLPTMAPWYRASGRPLQSHGCSNAETGMDLPVVTTPNLALQPAAHAATFNDLVADLTDGYAVIGGSWDMDQQKLTGQGRGAMVYRVKHGKLGDCVTGAGFLMRSPELWKSLTALGGPGSEHVKGFAASKGQPDQSYAYSVSAVPARIGNLSVFDLRRKISA